MEQIDRDQGPETKEARVGDDPTLAEPGWGTPGVGMNVRSHPSHNNKNVARVGHPTNAGRNRFGACPKRARAELKLRCNLVAIAAAFMSATTTAAA